MLELCEKILLNFFSVSTDKAANPVNVMGASKSLMEKLILSKKNNFRVSTARFANVAFSNGSLLDGFTYRLEKNQPLSCPSDIKRFIFHEQSVICLLATFLGDSGNIFFPKLDFNQDQLYFKDIAFDFLTNNGFIPTVMNSEEEAKNFDIVINKPKYPIYLFPTDTSGEKTYEEFYTDEENFNLKKYNSIGYIITDDNEISYKDVVYDFKNVFKENSINKSSLIKILKKYLPDFNHIEGKNLDKKCKMYTFFKRLLDLGIASTSFLILLPLFVPVIIILRLTAEVKYFISRKIEYKNSKFKIWKFATMLKNSLDMGTGSITLKMILG